MSQSALSPPASNACTSPDAAAVLAPHPVIREAYSSADQKRRFLNDIFDETAADYDRVERWLSLGSGRWYRRMALARAGLKPGMNVADVAVGTGLLAGEALAIVKAAEGGGVVGIDPSREMMRRAADRLGIQTVCGVAESLPFSDASFDFLTMGYALRHVEDLNSAFREFHRVMRSDGKFGPARLCILEISRPETRLGRALLRAYLGTLCRVLGTVCRLSPRTPELWAYYWETIDRCVPPDRVLTALREAGFAEVQRTCVGGIFSEYTANRA